MNTMTKNEFWNSYRLFKETCFELDKEELDSKLEEFVQLLSLFYDADKQKEHGMKMMKQTHDAYKIGRLYVNGWFVSNKFEVSIQKNDNVDAMPRILWDIANLIFTDERFMEKLKEDDSFPERFDAEVIRKTAMAFSKDEDYVRSIFATVIDKYIQGKTSQPVTVVNITPDEEQAIMDFFAKRTITGSFQTFCQLNPSIDNLNIDFKKIEMLFKREQQKLYAV